MFVTLPLVRDADRFASVEAVSFENLLGLGYDTVKLHHVLLLDLTADDELWRIPAEPSTERAVQPGERQLAPRKLSHLGCTDGYGNHHWRRVAKKSRRWAQVSPAVDFLDSLVERHPPINRVGVVQFGMHADNLLVLLLLTRHPQYRLVIGHTHGQDDLVTLAFDQYVSRLNSFR